MKWFFRIGKFMLTLIIVILLVQLAFIYLPEVVPVKSFKGQVNKIIGLPDISPKDTLNKVPLISENEKHAQDPKDFVLSLDEISAMEDISLKDKLAAFAVISKIPGTQLKRMMEITEDGVIEEEIEEVKVMLKTNLSANDISKLGEIITRNKAMYASGTLGK